jgi:hypothetical protein
MAHNTRRIAASWIGVAAALLATGTLVTAAAAGGSERAPQSPAAVETVDHVDDPYVSCMRSAGGSPESLEHWVDGCTRAANAFGQRYLDCMRGVGGSADTLERWATACQEQAAISEGP